MIHVNPRIQILINAFVLAGFNPIKVLRLEEDTRTESSTLDFDLVLKEELADGLGDGLSITIHNNGDVVWNDFDGNTNLGNIDAGDLDQTVKVAMAKPAWL